MQKRTGTILVCLGVWAFGCTDFGVGGDDSERTGQVAEPLSSPDLAATTPDEPDAPLRTVASWQAASSAGTLDLLLRNSDDHAASVSVGATLVGPSFPDAARVDNVLTGAAAPHSDLKLNLSLDAVSRVSTSVAAPGTLVQFFARAKFPDGHEETAFSDVVAVTGKQLGILGSKDSRRAWARSGLPNFDGDLVAAAQDPGKLAALRGASSGTVNASNGSASPNSLVSKYICIQQLTVYSDSGTGEDVWPETTGTYRAHSGGLAFVDGGSTWWGWLDVFGCTPQLSISTGSHTFDALSEGQIGATNIKIGIYDTSNGDGCQGCTVLQDQNFSSNIDSSSVQTLTYAPTGGSTSQLNVFPAVSLALLKNNGGTYEYRVQVKPSGQFGSATDGFATYSQTRLSSGQTAAKNVMIHELGHGFWWGGGGFPSGWINNLSYAGSNPPCATAGSGHSYNSIEYTGGAVSEGFGNFYSAATWNNLGTNADCKFDGQDCGGAASYAARYLKSVCAAPSTGLGVEWDWTRLFWDLITHTDGNGVTPTMVNLRSWLTQTGTYGRNALFAGNCYVTFDSAANDVGGAFNTVWDTYKGSSGVGDGVDVVSLP